MPRYLPGLAWLAMLMFATTACSSTMHTPKLNAHPSQRYELTVTANAPGPWDSVKGFVTYAVGNVECTPKDTFAGVHELPKQVTHEITLTRIDAHTWHGYFYRDALEGGNYFGLGVCHWEMEGVDMAFQVHGFTFSAGIPFLDMSTYKVAVPDKPVTEYFSKADYFDTALKDQAPKGGIMVASGHGPEAPPFSKNFGEPFPITLSVRAAQL